MIAFEIDGRPFPTISDSADTRYRRAATSIELYHLDHSSLNDWRRNEVYKKIRKYVNMVYKYQKLCACDILDRAVYKEYRVILKDSLAELRKMIAPDAGYSSAARAYLKMYRQDDPAWAWVDQMLTSAQRNSKPVLLKRETGSDF